jgi:hypothetical protein
METTPTLTTRYGETLQEGFTAYTNRTCRHFNFLEDADCCIYKEVAVKVQIIKILQKDETSPKKAVVLLDESDIHDEDTFDTDFFIVEENRLFATKKDVINILIARTKNTTDNHLSDRETEDWHVGDKAYVYNSRKQDITEGTILEIQAGRLHPTAILRTTIPDEAYMFEDRDRSGGKLACRVDILHRSPDRKEW